VSGDGAVVTGLAADHHLVGICGSGMSGIARVLLQRGHGVSGSDLRDGRVAAELRALGATVHIGHAAGNFGDASTVVVSAAVSADNPEVAAARGAGRRVIGRATMLAELMVGHERVLVAGTHGKTTTTSMVVVGAQAAGRDPTFVIGGTVNASGANAHAGTDPLFVAEADESDRSFLEYEADIAIVTNVELDHPDEFLDTEDVHRAFIDFLEHRSDSGRAVVCIDDPGGRRLVADARAPVVTYGTDPEADVRLLVGAGGSRVRLGERSVELRLLVPGHHNLLNATAALAAGHALGLDLDRVAEGLSTFTGAARRFQRLGRAADIDVIDDYAHHPTELRATLAAARGLAPTRIVVVVQPHRYSRTRVFGEELGRAAAGADLVIVTDVYGSGEVAIPGVNGGRVARAAAAAGADVVYEPHLEDVLATLIERVRPGDLVLTTGAGDVTQIGPALLDRLGGR
jgi:UDP-N-acetylmuramate--alanine ligase